MSKRLCVQGATSCATVFAAAVLASCAFAADVYVTPAADGTQVYSTQPVDGSSRLLLKGTAEARLSSVSPATADNTNLRRRRDALEPLIADVAQRVGIEPALVRAIAHVESRFNAQARSPAGAEGVMQLMPATARRYGVTNRSDPLQNLEAGARYFKDLLAQFGGNVALALAAYNSGESNVERHAKRVPPFRETMLYVPEVLTRYQTYRQAEVDGSAK